MRNGELKNVERAVSGHISDTVRFAKHRSAGARRFTSKAQEALQDGFYETTRALKLLKRRAEVFEDKARHYVKREPLKAVAATAGIALLVGLFIGFAKRPKRRRIFGAVV
jgi:ElaB/YqjD/DUF883 family membrane-anchored ribosome-binding protein